MKLEIRVHDVTCTELKFGPDLTVGYEHRGTRPRRARGLAKIKHSESPKNKNEWKSGFDALTV